ncbi:hypothetical protein [Paenibacillus sp. FSL H3-0286]|uniref:hypothetical protein n=1 Tax=Paenibacillus sp. FSL H3-0286 TaxID=2921427 RepID=UPI003249F61B
MTISGILDKKMGVEAATGFLRKANVLMAKWDASEGRIQKNNYAHQLKETFNKAGLTESEQKQYVTEMNVIMNENLNLWEMTR